MFNHLHLHSVYSFGEALGPVKDYIAEAKRNKQTALAKTDIEVLCGSWQFYSECKKEKIKPILGQEFYVAANDKAEIKDSSNSKHRKLVLLAKNNQGWKNLSILSSIAFTKYAYYHPRIDSKLLYKYREGLIALSGGLDGVIGSYWSLGEEKKALETARRYKAIFEEDFYLEAFPTPGQNQIDYNRFLIELRKVDGYKIVATNNVFYPKQEQAKYYPYLLMIKQNQRENEFRGGNQQLSDSFYLMSEPEMREAFENQGFEEKQINRWIVSVEEIVNKIEDIEFEKSFKLPEFLSFKDVKDKEVELEVSGASLLD